ncbi:MAG TPA: PQQ-binding-like beta-propeller repeat protein [Thermoanaerobaculia bacterium]|jgi:hypothetical protein
MFRRQTRLIVTCVAILLSSLTAFAAEPPSPFQLRDTAIIDEPRGAAYIAKPNGTIDAVDLAAGRTLWNSDDAALPLGVGDDLLVAQFEEKPAGERLRIVVIDTASGSKVSEATIPLPDGARALVSDELGKKFRATAEREGATFLITWYYQSLAVRGDAREKEEDEREEAGSFAGSVRIQARSGKVLASSGGPVTDVPARWRMHGAPPQQPWHANGRSVRSEGGRGGPLVLKRTESASGRPLPEQAVSNRALVHVASFDQRHLLVTERVGDGGPDDPEYRWQVFAMDTGERATELRRDVSATPFFVFGDSIVLISPPHAYRNGDTLVEVPLKLEAFRLSTSVAKWNVELRDLTYRGRMPLRRAKKR